MRPIHDQVNSGNTLTTATLMWEIDGGKVEVLRKRGQIANNVQFQPQNRYELIAYPCFDPVGFDIFNKSITRAPM